MSTIPADNYNERADFFAAALNIRFPAYEFIVMHGPKNSRIVQTTRSHGSDRSVHAFVNREGQVFKAASWRAPAAGVRGYVGTPQALYDLVAGLSDNDWAGGYLYARR